MAPWAHVGTRVDDVGPTFDIFPLGKLLWAMISGGRVLPLYASEREVQVAINVPEPAWHRGN
jgi:hypothetical protein